MLRTEETACKYGGYLQIYWISSIEPPTRVVLKLGGCAGVITTHTINNQHDIKCCAEPRTWTDSLERHKQRETNMRISCQKSP
jgi:hypothetical protein